MRICSVRWYDHPVIGDFTINFLKKADGTPYDTIVLAGENGSGKTTVLDGLFRYFSDYPLHASVNVPVADTDARIEIEIYLNEADGIKDTSGNSIHKAKSRAHLNDNPSMNTQYYKYDGSEVTVNNIPQTAAHAIYSQAAINFNVKNIRATTDIALDKADIRSDKSSDDLATEITQLFLDIDKDDSSELAQWVDNNKGVAPPDEVQRKRIKRFTKAFERVFGNKLKFKGVNGLRVLFEKNGREVSIDQLSSGEKQIVFRGGFLLRNRGAMSGAAVLLDEPELSMHPKWQEKILGFYRTLFLDESGLQTSQIFIRNSRPYSVTFKILYDFLRYC
jgi:energy-coupling factor transporter ATP-binding protein EcfA2